jgi:ATP-dependent Clp protease protease subunit
MPIGVPNVPYLFPGERQPQWIELYNRLSRERVVFLTKEIGEEISNQLMGLILYLSSEEENQAIFLYVNSPGGIINCGLSLVDTINYIKSDVITINVGNAASMAAFVVARGKRGNRQALPHARFMVSHLEGTSKGQATEIFAEAEEIIRLQQVIRHLYSEFTGKPLHQIALDFDREEFLNAREACNYGLIDFVRIDS